MFFPTLVDGHMVIITARRRYGAGGPHPQTFTWLGIRLPSGDILSLGDPWPCVHPKKSEVQDAVRLLRERKLL